MARREGVKFRERLFESVRELLRREGAHEAAIATGGMTTEATDRDPPRGCPDCGEPCVPTVHHILWECWRYQEWRKEREPESELMSRMGWDPVEGKPRDRNLEEWRTLVRQMGTIRAQEVKRRRARARLAPDSREGRHRKVEEDFHEARQERCLPPWQEWEGSEWEESMRNKGAGRKREGGRGRRGTPNSASDYPSPRGRGGKY